jgi:serine/threonine protein kinase
MVVGVPGELGGYRIDAEIARHGGGGAVYCAHCERTGESVALKYLPAPPSGAPSAERFEREMRLAEHLQHPNIVRVIDARQLESGDRLIAMELIDGEDLAARARRGRVLPGSAVAMLLQLGAALEYAHGEGVVHRDVKPANAMVDVRGHVSLMDFGLARHPDDTTVTVTAQILGTVAYMSPEQARGRRASAKSDVYALTGVLYTLLTGRRPYPGDTTAMLLAHLEKPPPRPSDSFPDLRCFDRLIAAGMAKTWDRRQSLEELLSGARLAAAEWAALESFEEPSRESHASLPTTRTAVWGIPASTARSVGAATTVDAPLGLRGLQNAAAVLFREYRVPLTMTAIFLFTLALILILRS